MKTEETPNKRLSTTGRSRYSARMASLWKLLMLAALLFMPLGMAPASAVAPHAPEMAGMAMGHCPDPAQGHDRKSGFAECTMACAAALPALEKPQGERLLILCEPAPAYRAQQLNGIHPETATPPPKRS